jgi:hypothetical protein
VTGCIDAMLADRQITCPYCWESIEVELDLSVAEQQYVEDCSVCCRPIVIAYRVDGDTVGELSARAESE